MKEISLALLFCLSLAVYADNGKKEHKKTGFNAGVLPAVTFSTDLGFQYGALTSLYFYGNGEHYPKYEHYIYAEVSRYTKGSGKYRLFYDSEYFIPGIRTSFELSYIPDQAFGFYGFNGYDARYNKSFEDVTSSNYKNRLYYNHKRNTLSCNLDLQSRISDAIPLRWVGGLNFRHVAVGTIPVDKLNKGVDEAKHIPANNTLYDDYVAWGLISENEANGGSHYSVKAGLIYDTRDNEPCPNRGIWSEVVLSNTYSNNYNFGKISLTHRQYFPLVSNKLNLAYRIGYQGVIYGETPFYLLPNMIFAYMPSSILDGLGGSGSVRGMLRNRTVGLDVAFANVELRYKFARFKMLGQHWYAAISPFTDAGTVLRKMKINKKGIPSSVDQSLYFAEGKESIHFTYGCGLHIAMNENFVIAADVARPVDNNDGGLGVYIGMNWLF